MTSKESQREPSPTTLTRQSRRTAMACRRCRNRKVKCEPLTDIPERTCQKCLGGGHECVYLSVEEEHRISYPPEHEYASGIRALSSEDDAGGPALSPRSAIQRSVDNVASSSTIPPAIFTGNNSWYGHVSRLPPPSTVYATPSPTHHHSYHVNHGMGLTSACDGGMWSFQSQGQPSYPSRDTSTLAFGYGHGAASVYVANQTMHAEAGARNADFPSEYTDDVNDYSMGNGGGWYDLDDT